ncbi:MAG: fumarylacetoacetate hydrolase family protein [Pseudomonadota bacterium]|nr:fumarylacetoacetate hydrolase family protein [Pseudomonadota bacterium]
MITRYVRAYSQGAPFWAIDEGGILRALNAAPWKGGVPTGHVRQGRLLAPVEPGKIIGIGSNYRDHAAEMGKPVPAEPKLFLKATSAIVGPDERIEIPPRTTRVDHEAELGVVIGRRCRRVSEADALDYVFGYTCMNDVTARDFQRADGVFARAKGFDTFCPVGPAVVTGVDPRALRIRCLVNDQVRQDGSTADMVFGIAAIISYVSYVMTLEPGDLIATGTPAGVGPLVAGDRVVIEIEGIGALANAVVDRDDR